jgi:VanZ family protein
MPREVSGRFKRVAALDPRLPSSDAVHCNMQYEERGSTVVEVAEPMIHLADDGPRLTRTNRAFDEITVRRVLQTCCIVGLLVLAFVGLGPATWQPRSGLGWEIDHFVGYCVITLMCCVPWPRPLVVGGALMVFAVLLEGLQAFMPDRSSYYLAAVYSAAGVLTAALLAELFVGAWRRFCSKRAVSAQPSPLLRMRKH